MTVRLKKNWFAFIILFIFGYSFAEAQTNQLVSFSDPSYLWGNGVERIIEEAYRQCIRTKIIDGKVMNIRIPFAMNTDRDILLKTPINFIGDGKGNPEMLWSVIEDILDSKEFAEYISALSSGHEKIIIFDMLEQSWSISSDLFIIARLKTDSFSTLPHRPYALTSGRGARESDVYNYIFCIGLVGMDCSGFVWHILSYTARKGGVDLGRALSSVLGISPGANHSQFVGTSFFSSRSSQIIQVGDEIRNLRPADVMLFRDIEGEIVHSAVIQSIDFKKGVIRYLQCNNVSLSEERGVHDSFIYFDPSNPAASLKDPSLHWTQKRLAPFLGEDFTFADDGERYRHKLNGGGKVIRLRALIPAIERLSK
jgi:hypothetical protein